MKSKVIFLDMDGVLVDFFTGMKRYTGKEPPRSHVEYLEYLHNTPREQFGYDFWSTLPKTEECDMIINHIMQTYTLEHTIILTKPIDTHGCIDGKIDWLKKNAPQLANSFFIGNKKWKLASKESILIDDFDSNIQEFEKHGGLTITVPRPWNSKSWCTDIIGYLKRLLEIHMD